ncbi:hypothetical protein [Nitrosomonas sp.]|uniref:hypothetical protein n=1 Tax=Nitrosomonas sp. TaxID=42353 RepID=UPI001D5FD359|nr:hypothetical protein [Nitrosomonas sp.]MBX3617009.1 hypothetical protein [Nitrosomonas sp.]
MKKYLPSKSIAALALLAGSQCALANTIVTLGDQDFADGEKPTTGAFLTAGAGEPAPFDGLFSGSDVSGPNFSASWTFSYGAIADTITGGSLILGIYDHESAASGSQVASFTVNGVDLTGALNTLFEAHGGASREDNVYTLALPASTFAGLASGTVNVALSLKGPGLGLFGETTFNGAALDFSTLDIATAVPEPLTSTLLLIGVPAVLAAARRKMA